MKQTILILLLALTAACSKQAAPSLQILGTWEVTDSYFPEVNGDLWIFTENRFTIERNGIEIHSEAYDIPSVDLSLSKDFNLFIFDETYMPCQNNPYVCDTFLAGTAVISGSYLYYTPVFWSGMDFSLRKVR